MFNVNSRKRKKHLVARCAVGWLGGVYSTSWKLGLYFVNIFVANWNLLTKICNSVPSFNRRILTALYLKSQTSAHAQLRNYSLIATIHKFHNIVSFVNLPWGYVLINGVYRQHHESGHVTFPRNNFWCATSY